MDNTIRARLEHQLGLALKQQRRLDEALAHMDVARALAPVAGRAQQLERALVLQLLNQIDDAAQVYEDILATDPLALDVHVLRAEIAYGRKDDVLASYRNAMERAPRAAALPVAMGRILLRQNRADEARGAFDKALTLAPDDATALAGLAQTLDRLGEADDARQAYGRLLRIAPDNGDVRENHCSFLLRNGDVTEAQASAEAAVRLRPQSQNGLALLGLTYRARGDARDAWLNDYENHVQIFDLEPPEGYSDMASFNRDLGAYLDSLHGGAQQYLTQTLRGGTQLFDTLFYNGHPLIDRLLPRITAAIQTYMARLAPEREHPLLSRRGAGFRYIGSWSSRLSDCGFHVNHIHGQGWISSCYYVGVPDATEDRTAQQGWIKFGEPPEIFGSTFAAQRTIQPKPGRLVLFPSYHWHGTVPFRSAQNRTTIAFDAIPA